MTKYIFLKLKNFFSEDQRRLFGLSLLYTLLCTIIMIMSGIVPIVGLALVLVINSGMGIVFLSAYKHQLYKTESMFIGFYNLKHVCFGMLWMFFKTYIWLLIPIAGIIITIVRIYEYRFVPYILIARPDINALDAPEVSKKETEGFKTVMFSWDIIILLCSAIIEGILMIFSIIPYIGILFKAAMLLSGIIIILFLPMLKGISFAMFYHEIQHKTLRAKTKKSVCPYCMEMTDKNSLYCSKCGRKVRDELEASPKTMQ